MVFVTPLNTITIESVNNVLPSAMVLGDVDANKSNELVVGTQDGELFIYRLTRNQNEVKLWRRAQGLGFINAVAVGNLVTSHNEARPTVCVANAEGTINLFLIRSTSPRNRIRSAGGVMNNTNRTDSKLPLLNSSSIPNDEDSQAMIQPVFCQQLIVNPKSLLIEELNDNEKHLIVSYYDRMIRIFVAIINEESDGKVTGRFTLKNSFSTNEQINVIHSRRLIQKNYELIVSQPGGAFVRFNPSEEPIRFSSTDTYSQGSTNSTEAIALDRFSDENLYAAICQDRIDLYSDPTLKLIKSIHVDIKSGHLCSLYNGPIMGNEFRSLVTVNSVDGDTYIIDRNETIIQFRPPLNLLTGCAGASESVGNWPFSDQIQAFTAGYFGDNQIFCFIYALAHSDKIIIAHSIDTSNTTTSVLPRIVDISSTTSSLEELIHPTCA